MADPLSEQASKARVSEILKASRRVVNLERRRGRLERQLEETTHELRTAKRLLSDLAGDNLPGFGPESMNIGELS